MRKRLRFAMPRVPLVTHRQRAAQDGDDNLDGDASVKALRGAAAGIINNVGKIRRDEVLYTSSLEPFP